MPTAPKPETNPKQPLYPLLFSPDLCEKVWGGTRLRALKGLPADGNAVGESWEASALEKSPGIVAEGPLAGRTLPDLIAEYGAALTGRAAQVDGDADFPLLVKLLDTSDTLSIQVHPDDALARRLSGCSGKNEMWYILEAAPDAFLYLGFQSATTPEEIRRRALDGTNCDTLNRVKARPGDVFFIPAGCVHALGPGLLVAEVQQSSDVTYRLFDFGRPRELHLDQALLAADCAAFSPAPLPRTPLSAHTTRLIGNSFFTVDELTPASPLRRSLPAGESFVICLCIAGECIIHADTAAPSPDIRLAAGRCALLPACMAEHTLIPADSHGPTKVLEIYLAR